jgi:hypothetical protein
MSEEEPAQLSLAGEGEYQEEEEAPAHPPREKVLHAVPITALEVLLGLGLFLPVPLYFATVQTGVTIDLVVGLAFALGLGLLLRRLASPAPSISALPAGLVWGGALIVLPSGPWGLLTALVAAGVLLLFASIPDPGEAAVPLATIAAQVALPVGAATVSFAVAVSLLGVTSPIYDVALVPTLGAIALVVYLFGREDVVPLHPPTAPPPRAHREG